MVYRNIYETFTNLNKNYKWDNLNAKISAAFNDNGQGKIFKTKFI